MSKPVEIILLLKYGTMRRAIKSWVRNPTEFRDEEIKFIQRYIDQSFLKFDHNLQMAIIGRALR